MVHQTRRMTGIEGQEPTVRWGTATLKLGSEVKLQIAGTLEPLIVRLNPAIFLGRMDPNSASEMDIDLTAYGAIEMGVSRRHAVLELLQKNVMITDLGSTNGTFLNEQRVQPQQRRIVRDTDEIRLGKLIFHIFF